MNDCLLLNHELTPDAIWFLVAVVDGQALEFERNPMYGAVMAGGHLSVSADDTIDDPEAPRHTSANRTTVTAPYGDSESLW
jgi:hypothetical protein